MSGTAVCEGVRPVRVLPIRTSDQGVWRAAAGRKLRAADPVYRELAVEAPPPQARTSTGLAAPTLSIKCQSELRRPTFATRPREPRRATLTVWKCSKYG